MLVGRQEELAHIGALVDAARSGESAALVIIGEAGVGKSALLDAARERAGDATVVRTRGVQSETDLAFSALHDVLRPLLDHAGSLQPVQRAALATALGLAERGPAERLTVYVSALSLLAAAAGRRPLLVLVDDAHWVDAASASALAFAGRRLRTEGVVMLVALRPGASPFVGCGLPELRLAGLGSADARTLVGDDGDLHPDVARRIVEQSGGNPLALRQVPRLLTEGQRAGAEPLPDPIPVGPDLERAFAGRTARLPEDERRALVVAAASGSEDLALVASALAREGLATDALAAAEADGLVEIAPGRISFCHPIVRSAVYHGAPPAVRRRAHAAVAAALQDSGAEELRAWHLAAAALGPDEEVAQALAAVAEAARLRGGYASAARALERAAALSPSPRERVARLVQAAELAQAAGWSGVAGRLIATARAEAVGDEVVELERLQSRVEARAGSTAAAFRRLVDAAARLEREDAAAAARLLVEAVDPCIRAGRPADALALAERARALADGRDPVAVLSAQTAAAAALTFLGDLDRANALVGAAAVALEREQAVAGDPTLAAYLGMTLAFAGEHEVAKGLLTSLVSRARAVGATGLLVYPLTSLAWLQRSEGSWNLAAANAFEAAAIARETGRVNDEVWANSISGWIAANQGRTAEAEEAVRRQLELDAAFDAPYQRMTAVLTQGVLAAVAGDLDGAAARVAEALAIKRRYGYADATTRPAVTPDLVDLLTRCGRAADAREAAEEFVTATAPTARPEVAALGARCRGLVAEADFEGHFERALALHDAAPEPFEHAKTLLVYGERLRRARRRSAARPHLHRALELLERLGAEPWRARADAELRASGAVPLSRPRDRDTLTPQELEVAMVVVSGATNKEAAARLFVSPKTIEAHLGHIYRKLGVRSRTELARELHREGPRAPATPA